MICSVTFLFIVNGIASFIASRIYDGDGDGGDCSISIMNLRTTIIYIYLQLVHKVSGLLTNLEN